MWKLCHNALPTDENVRHSGFSLPSKCACCKSPSEETSEHLFFGGDTAKTVWLFLARVFSIRPPTSLSTLCSGWFFKSKSGSFMDNLSRAVAACAIWELWLHRNHVRFAGSLRCPVRKIKVWAGSSIHLIRGSFSGSFSDCLALKLLDSPLPFPVSCRGTWRSWQPSSNGLTLTMNVLDKDGSVFAGGIIWNCHKLFIMSLRCSVLDDCLFQGLLGLLILALNLGLNISCIQSSHKHIVYLSDPNSAVPWRYRRSWKECLAFCPKLSFSKICPAANSIADIVSFHGILGACSDVNALPLPAKVALKGLNLPFFCPP